MSNRSKKPRVLIMLNHPRHQAFLATFLEDHGYQPVTAERVDLARIMLNNNLEQFDIVLTDAEVYWMLRTDFLSRLKAQTALSACSIVLLAQPMLDSMTDLTTDITGTDQVLDALKAGAYYYVAKPTDEAALLDRLLAVKEERNQRIQLARELHYCKKLSSLKTNACYFFQTLEEARSLAAIVAHTCPDPSRVVVALYELMVNAVEHGNLEIGYAEKRVLGGHAVWQQEIQRRLQLEKYSNRFACVDVERNDDGLAITICDQGRGFDWEPYLRMSAERAAGHCGRGIAKAHDGVFSGIEYHGAGNEVCVLLKTEPAQATDDPYAEQPPVSRFPERQERMATAMWPVGYLSSGIETQIVMH